MACRSPAYDPISLFKAMLARILFRAAFSIVTSDNSLVSPIMLFSLNWNIFILGNNPSLDVIRVAIWGPSP